MKEFATEQESFWSGSFGDSYTQRKNGEIMARSYLMFWVDIIKRTGPLNSCFEIGCNRGVNLDSIKKLLPSCSTNGLEINSFAVKECAANGHQVFEGSILEPPPAVTTKEGLNDLSFVSGVLIHIDPSKLIDAYTLLYNLSQKYILIAEYFNPVPVAIPYRGHENRLFKRDFASEFWQNYPSLSLVDYGFIWSKDPVAPRDDVNWFLFHK